MQERLQDDIRLLETSVKGAIERGVAALLDRSSQIIDPMVTDEGSDLIIRRAPDRWIDRGLDGKPMQAIGQAVILMRDNYGEIFTAWSNGAITYEECKHADVPAITLELRPAPAHRLRAVAILLQKNRRSGTSMY